MKKTEFFKELFYPSLKRTLLIMRIAAFLLILGVLHAHATESSQPQQKQITGTITGKDGTHLPGVNIVVTGTTQGTLTDADGKYSIEVPPGSKSLTFSFIGMESQTISIGTVTQINVIMAESVFGLDEVVVIGYGTVKKGDLTGAVSTVSSADFERVLAINALEALQARSPGLSIISNSGKPGSDATVQIRGVQSINGTNAPIYVVDGIITDNINNISSGDIESFTVLKDASSTAIYGARASNGVILVTTKRGSGKAPEFTFHSYLGLQTEGNLRIDLLNASEFLEIYTEAYEMGGITPPWNDEILDYYKGVDTDWVGLMQQTGIVQNYELGISGGSDNSNYYISANYVNNKGMVIGTDYEKYSLRFNSDHKIGDWIKFGNSLNVYASEKNGDEDMDGSSYYRRAFIKVPLTRAYEDDGDYGKIYNTALEHTHRSPLWEADNRVDNEERKGVMGNLYLTVKLMEGLEFTAKGNLEWNHRFINDFVPGVDPAYQWEGSSKNFIQKESRQTLHWISDFLLTYNKTFSDVHVVSALLGYSLEENDYEELWGSRNDTPNNEIQYLDAGDPTSQLNGNGMTDWAFVSTFGRLNYTYNNKYLFSGTLRRDGTSRLAAKKFGIFPSVAVAWRLSEEPFLDDLAFIDDLKIRASFGSVGNAQSIDTYGTIASLTQRNYTLNQIQAQGYTLSRAVNTDLKWESSFKKNFGIDAVLLKNQVYLTSDYFIENTHDLLFEQPIPISTGLTGSPFINAGEVKNTGFELELGYRRKVKEWSFDFSVNMSHVKNEVIDLEGRDLLTEGIVEGHPLNSFYGYKTNGLIRTADDLSKPQMAGKTIGDIWVLDIDSYDADGKLTGEPDGKINAADRTLIGKRYPDLISGALATVEYKNFTFQLQLQGVHGVDMSILEEGRSVMHYFTMWAMNHDAVILDRYHPTKNPDGLWPKVSLADKGKNREFSDFWLDDASFLRVKNINLNYNFNEKVCSFLKMSKFGVYASIQNLYTFTSFHGTEVDTTTDPLVGVPQPRTWTFGVRASF